MGQPDLSLYSKLMGMKDYQRLQQEFEMQKAQQSQQSQLQNLQLQKAQQEMSAGPDIKARAEKALYNHFATGQPLAQEDRAALETLAAMEGNKVEYKPDEFGNVRAVSNPNAYQQFLSNMGGGQVSTSQSAKVPYVEKSATFDDMPVLEDYQNDIQNMDNSPEALANALGVSHEEIIKMQKDVSSMTPKIRDFPSSNETQFNDKNAPDVNLDPEVANSPYGRKAIFEQQLKMLSPEAMLKARELGLKEDEATQRLQKSLLAADEVEGVISSLIDENGKLKEGVGEIVGGFMGMQGRQSASFPITRNQRKYQPYINQIKGQSFLQAFESLKGGGQITEVEGKKATEAITRLDQYQDDQDFALALKDLLDYSRRVKNSITGKNAREMQPQKPNVQLLIDKYAD